MSGFHQTSLFVIFANEPLSRHVVLKQTLGKMENKCQQLDYLGLHFLVNKERVSVKVISGMVV